MFILPVALVWVYRNSCDPNNVFDLGWGDNAATDGIFLSQDSGSTFTQLKTGSLDSQTNGVTLATSSGVAVAGEIGTSEESHQQIKCHVPSGEDTGGVRQLDYNIYYLYTS